MDYSNASNVIREKVKNLMRKKGTQITKIGEILGGKKGESSAQRYNRGKRFLDDPSEVKIPQLLKIAHYFERPLDYFLETDSFFLSSSEKKNSFFCKTLGGSKTKHAKTRITRGFYRRTNNNSKKIGKLVVIHFF